MDKFVINRLARGFDVMKPGTIFNEPLRGCWDFSNHGFSCCALQYQVVVAIGFELQLNDFGFDPPDHALHRNRAFTLKIRI